jgi:hypothetical protein
MTFDNSKEFMELTWQTVGRGDVSIFPLTSGEGQGVRLNFL